MAIEFTRRGFVVRGTATAIGAMATIAAGGKTKGEKAKPNKRDVYLLDADGAACGCRACRACQSHAANKLFASQADADAHRAHPHCRCAIVQKPLKYATWVALFGKPGDLRRVTVDRRRSSVAAVLRHSDV